LIYPTTSKTHSTLEQMNLNLMLALHWLPVEQSVTRAARRNGRQRWLPSGVKRPGLDVSVEPAGADVFELLAAGRFDVLFAPKVGPTPSRRGEPTPRRSAP
jgi:hypothetical protein